MKLSVLGLAGLLLVLPACGGGSSSSGPTPSAASQPTTPTPSPTPAPTPEPVRFIGASLPEGSIVPVAPLNAVGQQAPQLFFGAAITLAENRAGVLVQVFVGTEELRCMGGGRAQLSFEAGVEQEVWPAPMSGPATCTLPYSTSQVEFVVIESGEILVQASFPATYHFEAAP